jgi:hypothetical protein
MIGYLLRHRIRALLTDMLVFPVTESFPDQPLNLAIQRGHSLCMGNIKGLGKLFRKIEYLQAIRSGENIICIIKLELRL